jgi:chloramphenicol-sensitive protein RarD
MRESSKGTLAAVAAFSIWGVLPIFWKMLADVPILQVTSHRVIWTLAIIIPIIIARKSWQSTIEAYKSPKALWIHSIAAVTLAANWLIYVWATLNGHIIEAALGYYINPFLYILVGYFFWKERHSRLQIIAIVVAAAGVALQFPAVEGVPWVAFCLACTFAAYGMIRKLSPLGSFSGLTMETSILLPVALIYLAMQQNQGTSAFGSDAFTTTLLCLTGVATAVPLLCFARGARSISLTLLGILQFIGPTGQFLIGWLIYDEPMPPMRLASFALIWLAVILYVFSTRQSHKSART